MRLSEEMRRHKETNWKVMSMVVLGSIFLGMILLITQALIVVKFVQWVW
jgi:hypothetical protein